MSLVAWPLFTEHGTSQRAVERDVAAVRAAFGPRAAVWLLSLAVRADPVGLSMSRPHGPAGERALRFEPVTATESSAVGAVSLVARVERYVDAVRAQWRRTVLRTLVLLVWSAVLAPVWIAAIVDGLARRAVKDDTLGYQNPAAFTLASHAWIAAVMLPWFVVATPLDVPLWLLPVWAVVAMLPLNVAIAHLQPVFTR